MEKQNSMLKNKRSLDNIRNTILGHIQIDYRIVCAMINYCHKPCNADGENASKISNRMKQKAKAHKSNPLKNILKYQLGTKQIKAIRLSDISDFPRFKRKKLIKKVFFGTFQLKMSRSYIGDLIRNNEAYLVSTKIIHSFEDQSIKSSIANGSKIIAAIINSRHRRGQIKTQNEPSIKKFRNTYKVFILYRPNSNTTRAIQGKIT